VDVPMCQERGVGSSPGGGSRGVRTWGVRKTGREAEVVNPTFI
jgi:hypothetical protein